MQTLAFKKAVDNTGSADLPSLKPSPLLAAVKIKASSHRSIIYRFSYLLFALCLGLAVYPFVIDQPMWIVPGIFALGFLYIVYRREMTNELTGALGYAGNQWVLEQAGMSHQLELAGEVLCWSWIIIMPLKDMADGKTCRLLLFADSMNSEDNGRLRAWLRASLIPKA
ncbi:MAG TPA: protein YgfX [Cellvibrio sp.]|nr:protein YgfX [Cellvibrio sp.]